MHFLFYAALLLAQPAEKTDEALTEQVRQLVTQLDARQLTERDTAERKLLELGPPVLTLLPAINDRMGPETTQRLTRLRQQLASIQASRAAEPALITLKGDDLPLAEVLESLAKQSGNPIKDHRENFGQQVIERKIKADFDKTPFWQAFDRVLDQAELTVYGFTGERGLFVVNRPPDTSPRAAKASYAGMFRLEPLRFEAQRDLRNEKLGSLRLVSEVSWEPRLQPFAILQPLAEVSAVGDTREVITVAGQRAEPEILVRGGASSTELEIPFELPKRGTEKIALLKGKIVALLPGAPEEFRFNQLPLEAKNQRPKPIEIRKGGTVVTLAGISKNNDLWEVAVRIKFEAPSTALESHRGWMLENRAHFEDAAGKKFTPGGLEQTRQSKNEIGMNYLFELDQSPEKMVFVYHTPLVVLEVPVVYEFKDLQLP